MLPDAEMWKKWEATEAPLRQGRGWYPALDRHFLELLVISEIHCLAHPLHGFGGTVGNAGQAERIHRHASRVRRVACERIGAERLHAYCERVKEAFDAYMQGGWGRVSMPSVASSSSSSPPSYSPHHSGSAAIGGGAAPSATGGVHGGMDESDSESEESEEDESDGSASPVRSPVDTLHEEDEDEYTGEMDGTSLEDRGRKIQRGQGSVRRDEKLKSPRQRRFAQPGFDDDDEEEDEGDDDPFDDDQHEMEGELGTLRLDLAGVDEVDEADERALDRAA